VRKYINKFLIQDPEADIDLTGAQLMAFQESKGSRL
jgi:hypothetical protein